MFRKKSSSDGEPVRNVPRCPSILHRFISGFDPFVEGIAVFGAFFVDAFEYVLHKVDAGITAILSIIRHTVYALLHLKFQALGRLIWSRGRHATNIRYLIIVGFIWFVFLAGGVFQGRLVEEKTNVYEQFLSTRSALLVGNVTAATATAEKRLFDEPIQYTVREGETLDSIARQYGTSIESIKYANNLVYETVKPGQVLEIPPVEGTLHTVKKGDTIESLSRRYRVPSQTIVDYNYIDSPYTLEPGQIVTIPNAEIPRSERFYAGDIQYDTSVYGVIPYAKSGPKGTGQFLWPLGGMLTQGFHPGHPAIDIATNSGDIHVADKGVVIRSGWWKGGYGNAVQVDHGNGYVTTYAHMSSIAVSEGQSVEKGQKIGVVGSTGRSTGPHLHFTIQLDGKYLNPLSLY